MHEVHRLTFEDARLRLLNHANLPGSHTSKLPDQESFAFRLWQAETDRCPPDVEELAEDVLACLYATNRMARTQAASALAYPVSCILSQGIRFHRSWSRTGQFSQEILDKLEDAVYRIAFAWEQLLAGDIDDLLEGIDID